MPRRRLGDPADPLPVRRQRRVIVDGEEQFVLKQKAWILPQRGDIPFLRLLDDAMDGVNVVAVDISIGTAHFHEVRRLDRSLGERLERCVRRIATGQPDAAVHLIPLRIVLVVG